ncbi:MAG: polysaccharide deacetylase family protein [Spirochaetota bacterium]
MPKPRDFNIPIIMYHEISSSRVSDLSITPAAFEAQLIALRRLGFTPITFTDLDAILSGIQERPRRPVIFTFDDGYENFKRSAFPILTRHDCRAVVFIVTGKLGKTNIWDKAKKGIRRQRLMSKDDIRELAEAGMEFGSHSHTHADCTALTSKKRAREIRGSYEIIKKITGRPVMAFCYPYGHHSRELCDYIEVKSMYRFGVAIQGARARRTTSDRYVLPRVFVKPNDFLMRFLWKVFKRVWWNVDFVKPFR